MFARKREILCWWLVLGGVREGRGLHDVVVVAVVVKEEKSAQGCIDDVVVEVKGMSARVTVWC